MQHCALIVSLLLLASCTHTSGEQDRPLGPPQNLLLYYTFDEGQGTVARDASSNGLDATTKAGWAPSPAGHAAVLDGTEKTVVNVKVPEDKRFGRESWTFMALLKPKQFHIDDRQNQRRLFAFGTYPGAYLVLDIGGKNGAPMCYFCYKNENDKTISTGGSTPIPLGKDRWAHLALVCDRTAHTVTFYVNGYTEGPRPMNKAFDGNFVLDGGLTIGSGWHNYWGQVDEVKIYRSALARGHVEAEFERHKGTFAIKESEAALEAKKRAALAKAFEKANAAWANKDYAGVRELCQQVVDAEDVPVHFRSYGQLRIAQSYMAKKKLADARAVYDAIAANESYPEVHRYEARECAKEIARKKQGLPPRDPAASRTLVPTIDTFAAEVHVGPNGNDANDGSIASPFATLARARDAVRAFKAKGTTGAIGVRILPGEYQVKETLELTAEDSGAAGAPVVYRAEAKGTSVFYGGARLTGFRPVSDAAVRARIPAEAQAHVLKCDLKALGITEYGELKVRGCGQPPSPPTLELFIDRLPMTLARWPNEGFVGIRKLIEGGDKSKGIASVFEYDSDRHERWLQANDPWLFGYFHFLWADATAKIGKIDPEKRTITTAEAYRYGGRGMSTRQHIQYYAFNLLEEIDRPGEWYLDRQAGVLYVYPPCDLARASVEIGLLPVPMITMENVKHLRIEGLTFDLARYNGIVAKDCEDCLIAACTVSRMAGNGITIRDGSRNSLIGCDVHTIGRRATEVIGGERETLTPGNHLVENCRIHFFGRIDRTYTPAIQLEGVGHRVAHNLMYNCPSSAMRIEGNDHFMEYNEVHSAVMESDDQGGMELFRNATYRGVVFRYNYYHQVGKPVKGVAVHGQAGIRFDDAISGMLVYGNIFWQAANGHFGGVQMNSGRDNLMDNNIFYDCKLGISGGWRAGNNVWKGLRAGKRPANFYTNELYLKRYPKIATWLEEPGLNHVWRNVFYRCGQAVRSRRNIDLFENGIYEDEDPGFVNAPKGDFRLKRRAKLFQTVGFRPIPVEEIGLYESPYRASWPVHTTPVTMPDWRLSKK